MILSDESIVWLGCDAPSVADLPFTVPRESAVQECRSICSSMARAVAVVKDEACSCAELAATENIKRDISQCQPETDWGFYSASGLASQDSDYSVVVTVEKLGDKPYVKPLEAVLVQIATNFLIDIPFTVDFGDGTITDIHSKEISYFWSQAGKYDITVFAEIGIARISASTDISIEDVDEGYAGDFVILDTFHGDKTREANVDFTNIDYALGACLLQYGDRNSTGVELVNLEEYVESAHMTHIYPHFGRYKLHVDCVNPYGQIENNTFFISQKLDTTYHFHEKDTNFITPVVGDEDFFHNVHIEHNDQNITVNLNESNASFFEIQSKFLRIQENFLTYNFEDVSVDKRIISVQNIIEKPEIFSPVKDGAWNLTTNITVRVPVGNNMFLNVSFSSGEDQIFYIHYLQFPSDIVFEIMFPTLGYYSVQANISNDISYSTADMTVSVEVPLTSIGLSVTNITDREIPVELTIDLNDGMRGPMKVNFQIDQGNGYVDTYHFYSDKFFFPTYRHKYKYPNWGIYDICVRAFNSISSVIECVTVQIGERIKYVDVTMLSAGRFKRNETTQSVIRCPKGSDKTYIVEFGDGETFVFTDRYLKETEDFEDTTTTTPPTTSTMSSAISTESSNITTSGYNTTYEVSRNFTSDIETPSRATTNTKSTTYGVETSTGHSAPPYRRRRRDVNGTDFNAAGADDTMFAETSSQTTQQPFQETSLYSTNFNATTMSSFAGNGNTTAETYSYTTGTGRNGTGTVPTTRRQSTTTTTETPTTTSAFITSTMEPIPDDATNPYTTTSSFARRRRDGTILVTHRYQDIGTYSVKVKASNHFNWAWDTLCPLVIIADEKNDSCQPPSLAVAPKYASSERNPLQFFRSEKINLTAIVTLSNCSSSVPTYSWRTDKLVMEDGRWIRRPYHDTGICLLETRQKIFQYPRSSLPFGSYVVTLVVSPSDHSLKTAMREFFIDVNPSPPHAVINGNDEHLWFLVYGTTMLKFSKSTDPDFDTHDGIEYDLVFMEESKYTDVKYESRESMLNKSSLVVEGITHKYTSKNPVRVYEYTQCFLHSGNLTKDMRFPTGEFNLPSEYFVSDVNSFAMILYVTKNKLTTTAHVTFEIRLSNASNLLDQLDDLLASKDTTGVMRAVEALSATLIVTPVWSNFVTSETEYFQTNCSFLFFTSMKMYFKRQCSYLKIWLA